MLEIEIVDVNIVEGGVEVFARVWTGNAPMEVTETIVTEEITSPDTFGTMQERVVRTIPANTQIGFGKDGTIDIERFIFNNPPVLVQDPNGDIVHTTNFRPELELPSFETRYREDPEEATLQAIESTLGVMKNKFGPENIIVGKVGNTTSTFYGTYSAYQFNSNANYTTLYNDTTSVGHDTTSQTEATFIGGKSGSTFLKNRGIYHFDTSSIPDGDTISSATFSVNFTGSGFNGESTHPANGALVGVTGTPSNNTSDYGKVNETRYADTDILVADVYNTAGFADWIMNSIGIAAINKTGNTYLGIRMSNDFSPSTAPTQRSYALGYWVAATGTTNDPKLVVEHSASGTAHTKDLTATVTMNASVARGTSRTFTETIALVASIDRAISKSLTETIALVASVNKTTSRVLTETITLVANVSGNIGKLLTASIAMTASVAKSTGRTLTETLTATASIAKSSARTLTETVTVTATIAKTIVRSLTETVSMTATRVAGMARTLVETLSLDANVAKATNKALRANLTLTATYAKSISRSLIETITLNDTVNKTVSRVLTATLTLFATVQKGANRTLQATITVSATVSRATSRVLRVTLTVTATVVKATSRLLTETITMSASIIGDLITGLARVGNAILTTAKKNIVHLLSKKDSSVLKSKRDDTTELNSKQ